MFVPPKFLGWLRYCWRQPGRWHETKPRVTLRGSYCHWFTTVSS